MTGTGRKEREVFFFEKKKQKTFIHLVPLPVLREFAINQIDQVFLLLFVHKKKTSLLNIGLLRQQP